MRRLIIAALPASILLCIFILTPVGLTPQEREAHSIRQPLLTINLLRGVTPEGEWQSGSESERK
jgi:hypothetical protein